MLEFFLPPVLVRFECFCLRMASNSSPALHPQQINIWNIIINIMKILTALYFVHWVLVSHQTYTLRFPIFLSPYSRKNDGMREKETPGLALRECEFHQSLYSKIEETLEVYRKLVVWRCPQSLIHCNQERITGHYAFLVCLHNNNLDWLLWGSRRWTWGRFKQSIKMCGRPSLITTSKNNWSEIFISQPTP